MSEAQAGLKALLSQIPLTTEQAEKAEHFIKQCTGDELVALGLGPPARPNVPKTLDKLAPAQRLDAIQRVICSLGYNHMPGYCYNVSKDRPLCRIMDTAREVLREALPIKCVEAVFLGVLLTSNWEECARLPVGFKSRCAGNTYRHIVLAVRHSPSGQWGALGISRRQEDLGGKPLAYGSLPDLMTAYREGYEKWGHVLQKVRVGLPVEHNPADRGPVCWRYCNVSAGRHDWDVCRGVLERFADAADTLAARFKVLGFKPPSRGRGYGGRPGGGPPAPSATGTTPEPPVYASPARARPERYTEDGTEAGDSASEGGAAAGHNHNHAGCSAPSPGAGSPSPARKRPPAPPAAKTPQRPARPHGAGSTQEARGSGSVTAARGVQGGTPVKGRPPPAPPPKPSPQRAASCPRPRGRTTQGTAAGQGGHVATGSAKGAGSATTGSKLLGQSGATGADVKAGCATGTASGDGTCSTPAVALDGSHAQQQQQQHLMGTDVAAGQQEPVAAVPLLPPLPGSGSLTPVGQPSSRAVTPGTQTGAVDGTGTGAVAGPRAVADGHAQQPPLALPPLGRQQGEGTGHEHSGDHVNGEDGGVRGSHVASGGEWDEAVAVTLAGHTSESESDVGEGDESDGGGG